MLDSVRRLFSWEREYDDVVPLWKTKLSMRERFRECLFGLVLIYRALRGYAFMGWGTQIPITVVDPVDAERLDALANKIEPFSSIDPLDTFYTEWLRLHGKSPKKDRDIN